MAERPAIFQDFSIRRIRADAKHQTRRVNGLADINAEPDRWSYIGCSDDGAHRFTNTDGEAVSKRCRYGVPGDLLYIKETWSPDHADVYPCYPVVYRVDGYPTDEDRREHVRGCPASPTAIALAKAEGIPTVGLARADCLACAGFRWRPSIFMPKRHARIWLRVLDVRVERLQELSEQDARAEGAECRSDLAWMDQWTPAGCADPYEAAVASGHRADFRRMWDSLNSPRGFGWDPNPWVWAITFRQIDRRARRR